MTYCPPLKPITSFYVPFDSLYEYAGITNLYNFKVGGISYAVLSSNYHFKILRYIDNPNWLYRLLGIEYTIIYQVDKTNRKAKITANTKLDTLIVGTCINYVCNVYQVTRHNVLNLDYSELLRFLGEDIKKWIKDFNDFLVFDKDYTEEVNFFYLNDQEKLWLYELMLIKRIVKMPYNQ